MSSSRGRDGNIPSLFLPKIIAASVLLALFMCSFAFADEPRYIIPLDNSPMTGSDNAPVTVVMFIDFQ